MDMKYNTNNCHFHSLNGEGLHAINQCYYGTIYDYFENLYFPSPFMIIFENLYFPFSKE